MKIAVFAALVLGLAHYAAAFLCTWNGAGSSYVYDYTYVTATSGNCITGLDNRHAQTTCCRCVCAWYGCSRHTMMLILAMKLSFVYLDHLTHRPSY